MPAAGSLLRTRRTPTVDFKSLLPSSLPLPPLLHSSSPRSPARLGDEPRARLQTPLGQERPDTVWLQRFVVAPTPPPAPVSDVEVGRPIFIFIACLTVKENQIAPPGAATKAQANSGPRAPCSSFSFLIFLI